MVTSLSLASVGRAHFYLGDAGPAREWLERALETTGARIRSVPHPPARQPRPGRRVAGPARARGRARRRGARARARPRTARPSLARRRVSREGAGRHPARRARGGRDRTCTKDTSAPHRTAVSSCCGSRTPRRAWSIRRGRMPRPCRPREPPPPIVRTRCARSPIARSGRPAGRTRRAPRRNGRTCCSRTSPGCLPPAMRAAPARGCGLCRCPEPASPAQSVEHDILLAWLNDLDGSQAESRRALIAALEAAESRGPRPSVPERRRTRRGHAAGAARSARRDSGGSCSSASRRPARRMPGS